MSIHRETRQLPHAPGDIAAMVADVRRYPEFIRYITAMRVWDENRTPDKDTFTAQARIGFKFVRETFTTRVVHDRREPRVTVSHVEGPFRHLENTWQFFPEVGGGTRVEFEIDYEFRSGILQALVRANIDRVANRLISAFEARAAAVLTRTSVA